MFETAELGASISKSEYKERVPILREELLALQLDLRECGEFPVILVFAGVDGGGKGSTVNLLNEWMDPRWLVTHAYGEPSGEELERPEYWRFWRDLPPRGQIGLFLSSWYSRPILDRAYRRINLDLFARKLDRIARFESTLADDGALVLKFWMHLSKSAQKQRLQALETDPLTQWRVSRSDWAHWKRYEKFVEAAEDTILRTNTGKAPWAVVEGEDKAFRSLTVGTIIRDSLRTHLDKARHEQEVRHQRKLNLSQDSRRDVVADKNDAESKSAAKKAAGKKNQQAKTGAAPLRPITSTPPTVLDTLDMSQQLTRQDYQRQLKECQARASLLFRNAWERGISTIVVVEGPDAAGKGGAIRRLTAPLDARDYRVLPISAPTEEERAHHYLWRFWRHVSRAGRLTIFDRSWYGRVLVERVEGFAEADEWKRAYAEINNFEAQLREHGIVLLKFWMHISKDVQLARFRAREQSQYKSWKLTAEDWRNRDNWEGYERSVNDIVQYTSTVANPWILVEGNDKCFARIKMLKNVCSALEAALKEKEKEKDKEK